MEEQEMMKTSQKMVRLGLCAGLLVVLALVLAPRTALAAVCTTNSDGNWSSISWSGCTPGSSDDVVIAHDVTLDVDKEVRGITINSGKTLNGGSSTLTLNADYFTSNGTFSAASGTVRVTGANFRLYGNATTFNNFTLAGSNADFFTVVATINGTFSIEGGNVAIGKAPTYASGSTLRYATGGSYTAFEEWYRNTTSGPGVPHHIEIAAGTTLTFGSANTARTMKGNLTIGGTLTLSSISGGDLKVGGNWTNSGTFTPVGRAVFFNGSGTQTITKSGGETFAYLIVDKSAGSLQLADDVTVSANSGDVLQLLGAGNLDLNDKILAFSSNGGNVLASGGTRSVTGGSGSILRFSGAKTVTSASGGTLVFDTNVVVEISSGFVNFGSNLSTINGTLRINSGAVATNPPTYGVGSLLQYNSSTAFFRGLEWSSASGPGYPYHVQISNNGLILAGNAAGAAMARQLAGNLTIDVGSTLNMNHCCSTQMTAPLTVLGDVTVGGELRLSSLPGGDFFIGGNWSNAGTLTPNGRTTTFNGSTAQTIGGAASTTFFNLVLNNMAGASLGNSQTVNGTLTLTNGRLTLGGNNLTLGLSAPAVAGALNVSNMVVADGAGALCKVFSAIGSFQFPIGDVSGPSSTAEYSPATLAFSAGLTNPSTVCARVTDAVHPQWPGTQYPSYLTRYWTATSTDNSFTGTASFMYVDADVVLGAGQTENALFHKIWNGSSWTTGNQTNVGTNTISTPVSSFSDHTAFSGSPLAVTLSEFSATQQGAAVLVAWETASELDNRGFNLYRGVSPDGWDRQLNELLIPSQSQGSPSGFVYTWDDHADLVAGTTYYYWLEDLDVNGATSIHGPVSVDYVAPTAVTLSGVTASPAAGAAALPLAGLLLALLTPLAAAGLRRRA